MEHRSRVGDFQSFETGSLKFFQRRIKVITVVEIIDHQHYGVIFEHGQDLFYFVPLAGAVVKEQIEFFEVFLRVTYDLFRSLLREELGLSEDMQVTDKSTALLADKVTIKDFKVYSVRENDITIYDFDQTAGYISVPMENRAGSYDAGNGEVIEKTALLAEIEFTIEFMGFPVKVNKYHMVDMTNGE